jgi:hypothetical protein
MRHIILLLAIALGALPAIAQTLKPGWITDAKGCRVWNPNMEPKEAIAWSGACAEGHAQGYGVVQWFMNGKATDRFEGEYLNGRRHGRGVFSWANGDRYEGGYSEDNRAGVGVFTWGKGGRYDGEWHDNLPNGKGKLTKPDGTTYAGTFKNGCYQLSTGWLSTLGVSAEICVGR